MKLNVDLEQLTEKSTNDKTVCVRLPVEDYERLKGFHDNVSQVVRGLISQFIEQVDSSKRKWVKK